jgi:hypothetical protein
MNRFVLSELSVSRLFDAAARRILDIPNSLAWNLNSKAAARNKNRLRSYANLHNGQRCFILGNGPSLARMDLEHLKGEYTFGLNRIYLLFGQLQFEPTYYVCINELVLEQFAHEIGVLKMSKFINWNRRRLFNDNDTSMMFVKTRFGISDSFTRNLLRPVSGGGTVAYVALQIAYYMGFKEAVLIGVDHSFQSSGTPNKVEIQSKSSDVNHFHPDYFPKGSKWQLPDLRRSEMAYQIAKERYEEDNRRILDATVNGKCSIFKKANFEEFFS